MKLNYLSSNFLFVIICINFGYSCFSQEALDYEPTRTLEGKRIRYSIFWGIGSVFFSGTQSKEFHPARLIVIEHEIYFNKKDVILFSISMENRTIKSTKIEILGVRYIKKDKINTTTFGFSYGRKFYLNHNIMLTPYIGFLNKFYSNPEKYNDFTLFDPSHLLIGMNFEQKFTLPILKTSSNIRLKAEYIKTKKSTFNSLKGGDNIRILFGIVINLKFKK